MKLYSAVIDGLVLGGSLLEYYKFDKSYIIYGLMSIVKVSIVHIHYPTQKLISSLKKKNLKL